MRDKMPAWAILAVICVVAGGSLGLVNEVTKAPIAEVAAKAADATRRRFFPAADSFEAAELAADSGVDSCYAALQGGELIGYVVQNTVTGYGGPIEVQTGISIDGTVTGIDVGGPAFAETPGLGAKTKDAAFREQFAGVTIPAQPGKNVDAVTGATISSSAVCSAVNQAGYLVQALLNPSAPDDRPEDLQFGGVLPGATTKQQEAAPAGIDALYSSDAGCVAYVTGQGRNGPIQVQVGVANSGQVAGVYIDPAMHSETGGMGDLVEQRYFWGQFIGHAGKFAIGDDLDAVTGATISSQAVVDCVNLALDAAQPFLDPTRAVEIAPMDGGASVSAAAPSIVKRGAQVVKTGSGVTVLSAQDWAETYPDIYASYLANVENSAVHHYPVDYPMIPVIYEGMAFSKFYASARGHTYTVEDVTSTGRPHALANCFSCKTPDFTNLVNEAGAAAYRLPFEDVLAQVNEPVSCYNCHANTGDELVVTHTYLSDALGEELTAVDAETLSCAQCHVEYYFHPATKATTLPYTSLATMSPDHILKYYNATMVNGEAFADYVNPRSGVRQIKVQHPEFETYMGAGGVHAHGSAGAEVFTCADCHMGKARAADGSTYISHTWMSPLQNPTLLEGTCSVCHDDLAAEIEAIQAEVERRTYAVGYELEGLTEKLVKAVESGLYTQEELDAIRALARDAQFYWDFVFVENSEGAHNSALTRDCLDKAEQRLNQAMALFKTDRQEG